MSFMDYVEPMLVILFPIRLLLLSTSFLPTTLFHLLSTQPATLGSWSLIKDAWFARFWSWFGPLSAENASPMVKPLLDDHARGTVLDVGSGQGHFLRLYPVDKISKLYAIEPNKDHHAQLRASAHAAGFVENKNFEILDAKIEHLSSVGIQRGSIDTISSLQALCSIPHPEVLIPELRTYLKPHGGKWIVYEHVRRPERNGVIVSYQRILNIIWPQFLNGCNLTRRTKEMIEGTGGWQSSSQKGVGALVAPARDSPYTAIPSVYGVLVSQ